MLDLSFEGISSKLDIELPDLLKPNDKFSSSFFTTLPQTKENAMEDDTIPSFKIEPPVIGIAKLLTRTFKVFMQEQHKLGI